jgi:hypothetical protein
MTPSASSLNRHAKTHPRFTTQGSLLRSASGLLLGIILLLSPACSLDDDGTAGTSSISGQTHALPEPLSPDILVLPDFIHKDLMIAAFDQIHAQDARVYLTYTDTSRKEAIRYSVFANGQVEKDTLTPAGFNEFSSKSIPSERYLIRAESVLHTKTTGNVSGSVEYLRTDHPVSGRH